MTKKKPLKALIVIAHLDFDDDEFSQIRMKLMDSGIGLDIASSLSSDARGKNGLRVKVDVTFINIDPSLYKVVIFIGGEGIRKYYNDTLVLSLAQAFDYSKKWTCAIGEASAILAHAGILKEVKATGLPEDREMLENHQCDYQDEKIVLDKHILTGKAADSADRLAGQIVEFFKENQ